MEFVRLHNHAHWQRHPVLCHLQLSALLCSSACLRDISTTTPDPCWMNICYEQWTGAGAVCDFATRTSQLCMKIGLILCHFTSRCGKHVTGSVRILLRQSQRHLAPLYLLNVSRMSCCTHCDHYKLIWVSCSRKLVHCMQGIVCMDDFMAQRAPSRKFWKCLAKLPY